MSSKQITVPNGKESQKFTIGEIARMILETHESSPAVDAQYVIMEIMKQAEDGEPPVSFRHGVEPPDEEIVFLTAAGHPYKSTASAGRAARTRADLQDIVWEIVSVDGGWVIREIYGYDNWFEYHANKETMSADEIGYMALASTADMTRFCRSTVYREWASQLGLGVPVMFGGEGTPLAVVPGRGGRKPGGSRKPGGGRKPGSGSFAQLDAPLVKEMKELIDSGKVVSPHAAATQIADRAKGAGTPESKVRRLINRFNEKFGSI